MILMRPQEPNFTMEPNTPRIGGHHAGMAGKIRTHIDIASLDIDAKSGQAAAERRRLLAPVHALPLPNKQIRPAAHRGEQLPNRA
jgi:hypothetical protein